MSKNVLTLELVLRQLRLEPVREYRFHETRMWRFDLAVPSLKLACEYQGHAGLVGKRHSGHSTISGLTRDCEKLNQAHILGWTVFTFTALHFSESERLKKKLTSPVHTLENWIKARANNL